jgi:peptidyl-prolyl cis-trans isomerase C
MVRWSFIIVAMACFAGLSLGDAPSKPADGNFDEVLVSGKAIHITQSQLDQQFHRVLRMATESQQVIPEASQGPMKAAILEQLVFIALTTNRATASEVVRAKAESAEFVRGERERLGGADAFQKHLNELGVTEEGLGQQNFAEVLSRTVVDREVKARVKIPTADLKAYYDEDGSRWNKPEMARVAHILFATQDAQTGEKLADDKAALKKTRAEAALQRAKKGEDFGALVRDLSDDAPSKARDGEYLFQRGQMPKEFEDAAFALKPGEISGVVKTEYGYHIIKLLGRIPGKSFSFAEVESQVRELMVQREMQVRIPEYADRIKKEAGLAYSPKAPRRLPAL